MSLVNRRSLAGFCAAGAIALAAGCGGGGDTSDALSADEFRSQADAICQASEDTVDALDQPTSSSTNAELAAFLRAGIEANDDQLAKLRALAAPADLADTLDEALDLLEQQQTRLRAAADRVAGGEAFATVVAQENEAIQDLNDQADAKAKELGLTVCGADDDETDESATTSTGTTATAPDTTGGGLSPEVTTDIRAVETALLGVSQSLQSASGTSLEDLQKVVPEARAKLAEFDDAIAELASDTSSNAAQEKVRTAVATAGPKVSDVLGRLLDAFEDGDEAAAAALVPEFQKVFGELQTALTG